MVTKQKTDEPAQGAKVLTESDFSKMVQNDLKTATSFLMAVMQDQPTVNAMCEFLYGRYLNQLHKKDLESQTKIDG